MIHNFKKDFKPYLDNLRIDNKVLKDHFLNDVFIKQVREHAREKIEKAINPKTGLLDWNKLHIKFSKKFDLEWNHYN